MTDLLAFGAKGHTWIEKMSKPNDKIILRVEPLGLFNFPEEFQNADVNGYFEYSMKFRGLTLAEAKFNTRQQTEEEQWLIEEEKNAKTKKKPKGQEGPTPEELEKQNYFAKIKQDDDDRLAQMTEDERFYDIREDIYKTSNMKWPEVEKQEVIEKDNQYDETATIMTNESLWNNNSIELIERDQVDFEEKVWSENSGDWIYFFRNCNLPEEEVGKMKKKLKGNQLTDLNQMICKAWLPLNELKGTNSREFIKRIDVVQQPMSDDPNVDPTTYGQEKCYIKLRIRVSPTLVPEVKEPANLIYEVLPKQIPQKKVSKADR